MSNLNGWGIDGWSGANGSVFSWDETTATWNFISDDAYELVPGQGYGLRYGASNATKIFKGLANTGLQTVGLSLTDVGEFGHEGWNLLGNPYPSALDLEELDLPMDVHSTFYTYNPNARNFKVYQKGGLSLNGGKQAVKANEAFFVKTDAAVDFNFQNVARVHFINNGGTKELNHMLKLKVSNDFTSDELAILFNADATDNFEKEYDATKFYDEQSPMPVIFTKIAGDDAPISINTMEYLLTNRTIPIFFKTGATGTYTIEASDLIFDAEVTVILKDTKLNTTQDLRTNPSYSFTHEFGDAPNRFEVLFSGFVVGVDDVMENTNVNIFSNNNNIIINSNYDKVKLEVYNLNGQLLLQKNINNSGTSTISTNLAQGIYIVKVISNEEIVTKKIVLTK